MPKELNEISGITFADDNVLACIQDEKGIIFLYDLEKSEITKRIHFGRKGDYEGIAISGNTAYIISGNGILYEVNDYMNSVVVNTYELALAANEESEAICYDPSGNRLLLAFKNEKDDEIIPAIFAFDLHTKKLSASPVIKVDLRNALSRKKVRNDIKKLWKPADLAIDQVNNKIHMVDAINGHFLTLTMNGELEDLIQIDPQNIDHPEGIAIDRTGNIFICNDANNKGKGKIVKFRSSE